MGQRLKAIGCGSTPGEGEGQRLEKAIGCGSTPGEGDRLGVTPGEGDRLWVNAWRSEIGCGSIAFSRR